MSTNFPYTADSFTNPTQFDTMDGGTGGSPVDHDVQHSDANDAITAVETALFQTGLAVTAASVATFTASVATTTFTSNAYTFRINDANTAQQSSNGSTAASVTVPTNASVPFLIGNAVTITQIGTGKIQIVAASGVTIQSSVSGGFVSGTTGTRAQYSTMSLLKTGTNTWVLAGDVA